MSSQVKDISAALAYQVKKEIAENYFGSRKDLEEEREDLLRHGEKIEAEWGSKVLPILRKICQFLIGEAEIRAFLKLIQREDLFPLVKPGSSRLEAHLSPAECTVPFALTVKGKFKKMIFSLYHSAKNQEEPLGKTNRSLQKKVDLFNEDLIQFNACYQLSEILSFIHSLDSRDDLKGVLGESRDPRAIPLLEEKMVLKPIDQNRRGGAFLRPLPPIKVIQTPLKLLLDLAFQSHCSEIKDKLQSL